MENKELHPNIVIRRHIKSTAKAGKIIADLMNLQIQTGDPMASMGTITKRCKEEGTLPYHSTRFFRKWIKKKGNMTYADFDKEILNVSAELSNLYGKILLLDKYEQRVIIALATHLFYHHPLKGAQ